MRNKKHILLFLAGAEAFHTLAHLILAVSDLLPFTIFGIMVTPVLNMSAVAINAFITLGLLTWASRTPGESHEFFCDTQPVSAAEQKRKQKK